MSQSAWQLILTYAIKIVNVWLCSISQSVFIMQGIIYDFKHPLIDQDRSLWWPPHKGERII